MQPFSENLRNNYMTFVNILNWGSEWSRFFRMVLTDNHLEVASMSRDHQLKFSMCWGKTRAAPLNRYLEELHASRSLQSAMLNYTVFHTFLSMLWINLLSPSSGCQCSIQLKQIITHKIKANVLSKHWDNHPTWCRPPKCNVSWRVSTEGHKSTLHTGTGIMISFSSCEEISSLRQQNNIRACYSLLTLSLHPSQGKKACMHTNK
jgi:hypothetical protein